MSKQEKRRLYIVGAIIVAVIILLLLLRNRAVAGNTVINQAGDFNVPDYGITPFQLGGVPSLDYTGPKVASRGCAVCYSGYSRIVQPSPSPPPATITNVTNYLVRNFQQITKPTPPPPSARPMVWSSSSGSAPSRSWWEGMAPGGRV